MNGPGAGGPGAGGPAGRGPAGRRPGGRGPGRESGRDREPYAGRESFPDGAPRQAGPPGAAAYDQPGPAAPPRGPGRARGLPPGGTGEPRGRARASRSAPRAMMTGPDEHSGRGESSGQGRWKSPKRSRVWLLAGAAGLAVGVVVVTVGALLLGGSGPAHALVTPAKLGAWVRKPQLEQQMNAKDLQQQVVAKSAGQASHVVDAVYEANSKAAGGTSPQVILFIGGHLSGVSPTGFITSFTDQFKGALSTGAGSMGGRAACVNAQGNVAGNVALCTWADNDTFGLVASPTMDAAQLGAQMRAIRPDVEHVAR
jgi:hypothetical protein